MELIPPTKARERLLVFGAEGSGKTRAWFSILSHTAAHAYVLDTDYAVDRFLASDEFGGFESRITAVTPTEWPEYGDSIAKWQTEATVDDWLVIDLFGAAWDAVQNYFSQRVYGVSDDEHMLTFREMVQQHREESGKKNAGSKTPWDATMDWPAIKKMYRRLTTGLLRWPGHVFLACGKKAINEQYDDADTKERYGRSGAGKPDAEKTAGHLVHTVIAMKGASPETWRMQTIKDRQRQQLNGQRTGEFALSYLAQVAGWRPAP